MVFLIIVTLTKFCVDEKIGLSVFFIFFYRKKEKKYIFVLVDAILKLTKTDLKFK